MKKKIPFTIVRVSDKEVRLVPNSLLSVNKKYIVVVKSGDNGVKSQTGDKLSSDTTINFSTSDLFTILSTRETGSRNSGTYGIIVTFSKPVKHSTISSTSFKLTGGNTAISLQPTKLSDTEYSLLPTDGFIHYNTKNIIEVSKNVYSQTDIQYRDSGYETFMSSPFTEAYGVICSTQWTPFIRGKLANVASLIKQPKYDGSIGSTDGRGSVASLIKQPAYTAFPADTDGRGVIASLQKQPTHPGSTVSTDGGGNIASTIKT